MHSILCLLVFISSLQSDIQTHVQNFAYEVCTPVFELTDTEIKELSTLVYLECGSQSPECQAAVTSVILNRMTAYGTSLHDVIYAPHQFTPAHKIQYVEPSDQCIQVVKRTCFYGSVLPPSVLYFRNNHYFSWATPYTCIDNVYFSMK